MRRLRCQHHERKIIRRMKQKLALRLTSASLNPLSSTITSGIAELAWCWPLPSCRTMKLRETHVAAQSRKNRWEHLCCAEQRQLLLPGGHRLRQIYDAAADLGVLHRHEGFDEFQAL